MPCSVCTTTSIASLIRSRTLPLRPLFGKRLVIDPRNPETFLTDGFHIMNSTDSFVLQPVTANRLEIHFLVMEDCPKTDD